MNRFWIQLGWELQKLFARKRTYIGFGAFAIVEIGVLCLLQLPRVQRVLRRSIEQTGYLPDDFLSGLTLGLMMLMWTIFLLGALYLALVAGDVVGKEVEDGTMRMILCRPISRRRVLLLKALACGVYTVVLVLFIGLSALLAGYIYAGGGGLFVFAPQEGIFALHDFSVGMMRYLAAIPLLTLSLLPITCLAFFFSCLNMKPAAATITTLSIFLFDTILRNVPYFESLHGWFFTARMGAWVQIFQYNIPWETMLEDYLWLGALNATLLLFAWSAFESRDFKS